MKKLILLISGLLTITSFGQTATNFNVNDCSGINHDLFTELNSGKVVVMVWVMPCASCINGALSAQSAVQSFSTSNPGQVYFYCVDDYANTSCGTLSSWCTANGVINTTAKFSNAAINMSNYGTAGMPKVVVLGGSAHTVYYNQNNAAITTSGITNAINSALSAIAAGVEENSNPVFNSMNVFPNPSNNLSKVNFTLSKESKVVIEVQNQLGQKVTTAFNGDLQKGENTVTINTSELSPGNYLINVSDGDVSKKLKLVVVR